MSTTVPACIDVDAVASPELRRRLAEHADALPASALAAVHAWIATAAELLGELDDPDDDGALGDLITETVWPAIGVDPLLDVLFDLRAAAHRAYTAAFGDTTPL